MEAVQEEVVENVQSRKTLKNYRPRKYRKLKKQMKANKPMGDQIDLTPMVELLYYIYEKNKTSDANGE